MQSALTLDQLRVLVTVAETGSFSAAGRSLRRAQSAISHAIQAVERVHEIELFDRRGRTPVLTDAGRVLVAQARQVLSQAERFERTAKAISSGLEPELGIAVDSMVPTEPIRHSLSGLQAAFPDLTVSLFTDNPWSAAGRLHDGSAALAVSVQMPPTAQGLRTYPLTSITMVPVASPDHPLARGGSPVTRDILEQHVQLILTEPIRTDRPSMGVISPRVWRFVDIASRLEFLVAGFGWGYMPYHLVSKHLAEGDLKRLHLDDPALVAGALPIHVAHREENPPGVATRWLLAALQQQMWPAPPADT